MSTMFALVLTVSMLTGGNQDVLLVVTTLRMTARQLQKSNT